MSITKRNRYSTPILIGFFLLYLYLILSLVFFDRLGSSTSWHGVNLVPLESIVTYLQTTTVSKTIVFENLFGNLLLFVPLGIFLREFNWFKKWPLRLALILLLSFSIESLQYWTQLGSFDVDDILLNTVGGALGLILQAGFRACLPAKQQARFYTMLASVVIGLPSAYYIFFLYSV